MHDGALDDTLESQRRLRVDLRASGDHRGVFGDELAQALAKFVHVGGAGLEHVDCGSVIQQREQKVFDRDEFMASRARLDKCHVQADFKLLGNHIASDFIR